jgi:alkanesulfonate monooxygenase SsuD/methylene tetrahydromethanopterin reductase-like flavin-dependent oxidoreductase (luciferase family)
MRQSVAMSAEGERKRSAQRGEVLEPERTSVRLGVRIAPRDVSPAALADCVGLARAAEAVGLGWIGVAERWGAGGGVPDALTLCAAFAAVTTRARIATAALPLPLHHPLRVAEHAATIDSLSGGRLELGVGLGAAETPFGGFGLDEGERAERFTESVEILRAAWGNGLVTFRGKHFACENVAVFPKPARDEGPPLWLAASAPAALRRAAQLGVGVMAPADAELAPYFAACAGADARVVLLAPADASREQLAAALARCAAARELVCVLDATSEREIARVAALAAALGSS